jgi:hypothetical protein
MYKTLYALIAGIVIGESIGVARANRHWFRQVKPIQNDNERLCDKLKAVKEFIENTKIVGYDEAMIKLEEHLNFIDIIHQTS